METINYKITGIEPLLLNNPCSVDPFNKYSREKKVITSKRAKTDEDLIELRRLEVEAKLYYDEKMGVYVPATWISAALAGASFKRIKISKAEIRSAVFPVERRIKLNYEGMNKVKSLIDVARNPEFIQTMLLKQGQVKLAKCAPVFHDWHFSTSVEFDPGVVDRASLIDLMSYVATYGGFGDFRPTYGRATFTEI